MLSVYERPADLFNDPAAAGEWCSAFGHWDPRVARVRSF